jgi:hypothetical protein
VSIVDWGLQIADCGLPIADCRLPIADCRLQIVHAAECRHHALSAHVFRSGRSFPLDIQPASLGL